MPPPAALRAAIATCSRSRTGAYPRALTACLVLAACGEPLGLADFDHLELSQGNGQIATVATAVEVPPAVRALTVDGKPIPGLNVRFEVTAGGGSLTGGNATTDEAGVAAVTSWTLGETAGSNAVRATVSGTQTTFDFEAIGLVGDPASIDNVAGDHQTFTAGRALPVRVRVLVRDEFGNPVANTPVLFSIGAEGPAGIVDTLPVNTGADGMATARAWTLDPKPGANSLVASAGTATTTFAAVGVSGPVTLNIVAGNGQWATVNTAVTVSPRILVVDALGLPVVGVPVAFQAAVGGGNVSDDTVRTDAAGEAAVTWTLGTRAGLNRLTAQTDGLMAPFIEATGQPDVPAVVAIASGDGQFGAINRLVPLPIAARVTDQYANPVPGVPVTFTVTSGGGSLADTLVVTDAGGLAVSRRWIMGATTGANTIEATVTGAAPATFTATALTAVYDIQVTSQGGGGQIFATALSEAVARWRSVIIGDLPDVDFSTDTLPAGTCGSGQDEINTSIDDLRIYSSVEDIDGPGGVLGSAGPCVMRDTTLLPVIGVMRFDREDINRLDVDTVRDIVLHEMGHILGIGTAWDTLGFLVNPSLPPRGSKGADTHFSGLRAIAAFDALGGTNYTQAKVPVENTRGGQGTQDSHWRENVLRDELMTGFVASTGNPLSLITIEALGDLGYTVNGILADVFSLPFGTVAADVATPTTSALPIPLVDDVRRGPIYFVNRNGRIIGTRFPPTR